MSMVRPIPQKETSDLPMTGWSRVTTHAIRRYIERVMQFPCERVFPFGQPDDDVAWVETIRGHVDVSAVVAEIFSICRPAMESRARSVFRDHIVYVLSPAGNVTTILPVSSYMRRPLGGQSVKRQKQRRHERDRDDLRFYGSRFAGV